MKKFKFEVTEKFTPGTLKGKTKAESIEEAIADLKEFYAYELDTVEEEIHVKISEI